MAAAVDPHLVSTWAHLDRCQPRPVESTPAAGETVFVYPGCSSRSGVELYRLDGVGHVYPATLAGKPANMVIYNFFIEHRRR